MTIAATRSRNRTVTSRRPRSSGKFIERRGMGLVAPIIAIAVICGAWEIATQFTSPLLISSPQEVARDLVSLFSQSASVDQLLLSLREMYIGLAIGLVSGFLVGVVMGRFAIFNNVLSPFVNVINATPANIFLPLLVLWVGISSKARILFVVVVVFFPVLLNTFAGIRNVSKGYLDVAKSFGLNERRTLLNIILPASAPYLFAGLRLGVSGAIIGMIVGELEISQFGLGWLMLQYGEEFKTGDLLALLVVTAFIGVVQVVILRNIERVRFKWITAVR